MSFIARNYKKEVKDKKAEQADLVLAMLVDAFSECRTRASEGIRLIYNKVLEYSMDSAASKESQRDSTRSFNEFSSSSSSIIESDKVTPFNYVIDHFVREIKENILQTVLLKMAEGISTKQRVHATFRMRQIIGFDLGLTQESFVNDPVNIAVVTNVFDHHGIREFSGWKRGLARMFMDMYTSDLLIKRFQEKVSAWLKDDLLKHYPILNDVFEGVHLSIEPSDFIEENFQVSGISMEASKRLLEKYQYIIRE